MALTAEDLKNIEGLLDSRFNRVDDRLNRMDERFDRLENRFDDLKGRFERMESRLLFSIDLVQRHGDETLEDHERRIRRLEKIQTS